jgi:hypothetical protein
MELSERLEAFKEPLSYIKSQEVKKFAERGIELLPDYFFVIPASSGGRYHPSYAAGEGGLLRHTISAVRIAVELSRMTEIWKLTSLDLDLIIASLILHDGWKSGETQAKFTAVDHPEIAVQVLSRDEQLMSILPEEESLVVFGNIGTHMGQWNTDYKSGIEVLQKPSGKKQIFTHLCDYLASRKCLEMNFEVPLST